MSNNNQSSVEWLINEIERRVSIIQSEPQTMARELMIDNLAVDLEQAKTMHKEEGVDLYVNGMYKGQELYFGGDKIRLDVNSLKNCVKSAEEYYNETYGGNNEQQ